MKKYFLFLILILVPMLVQATYHAIHLDIDSKALKKLLNYNFAEDQPISKMRIDGKTHDGAKLKRRGNSSRNYTKGSYTVSFDEPQEIWKGFKAKDVFLLGHPEDPFSLNNFIGYALANHLGLYDTSYFFAELFINGLSQGMYMLTEPPNKQLKRRHPDIKFILRRLYIKYELKYSDKKIKNKLFAITYSQIHKSLGALSGRLLADFLNSKMNLDTYNLWLALNSFLENADYIDELYWAGILRFTENNSAPYFNYISAWDFDDIFQSPRNKTEVYLADGTRSLVHSGAAFLDQKIGTDPFLYKLFKVKYQEMLISMNRKIIENVFSDLEKDILPYYEKPGFVAAQRYFYNNPKLDKKMVEDLMQKKKVKLLSRYDEVSKRLKSEENNEK